MRTPETETAEEKVVLDMLEETLGLIDLSVWDLRCTNAAMHALKHLPATTASGAYFTAEDVAERLASDLKSRPDWLRNMAEWQDAGHTAMRTSQKMKRAALARRGSG